MSKVISLFYLGLYHSSVIGVLGEARKRGQQVDARGVQRQELETQSRSKVELLLKGCELILPSPWTLLSAPSFISVSSVRSCVKSSHI